MSEPSPSAGRSKSSVLQALLKRRQEAQATPGAPPDLPKVPPQARGRASLLKRLEEKKKVQVGSTLPPFKSAVDIPQREKADPVETLSKTTEQLSIAETAQPEPCQFRGTTGTPLTTTANYIELAVEEGRGVYEYEVRFSPDVDARSNRLKLVNEALGEISKTKVYDGSFCLYLPLQLFEGKKEFVGQSPISDVEITTSITFKKKKRLGDRDCLHLYNVLFKRIMYILLYTQMGRNYFSATHKQMIPQHRLEVFPGYAISVDEREGGLLVCLDTLHRVMRSQTAYELLIELRASCKEDFKNVANKNLVGSCVMTKYNYKTYTVHDIGWDAKPRDTFELHSGTQISFVQYYKQHYNIEIQDHDQPLLIHRETVNMPQGKVEKYICLVPELCYLTGLTDAMRSDFKVMKDVAAFTRVTPNQRMLALRIYLEKVQSSEKAQKILSEWGLKLADKTVNLYGRVLEHEQIIFGNEQKIVSRADWNRAVADNRVTGPMDINNWIIFYTRRDNDSAKNFGQSMTRLAKSMGAVIREPQYVMLNDDRSDTYLNGITSNITSTTQVVVFICPTLRSDRYTVIKKMCCTQMPIASQVILSKTLRNPDKVRAIIYKIALQINCKLGGTLWHVPIPVSGLMVCGIDVYHGVGHKSVCAFVASLNQSVTRWYSDCMFQEGELGDFFNMAFKKALYNYKETLGTFPSRIIIYRDGLGIGQLPQCEKYEISQFESVLKEFNIECSFIFIVVQKRINTKIFSVANSTYENPPSGTVVDTVITNRDLYDFYLIPQTVRQGTVNPTHYIVVKGAHLMKPDHIQRLSYKLCHLYYNWCGTIRVPAPCQYAHKLAQLIGMYVKKVPSAELSKRLYYL